MASIAGLKARDPGFDPTRFVEGARQAYETIVQGYASGDRAALKPLLTPTVMRSFEAGIAAREQRGERDLRHREEDAGHHAERHAASAGR